ncbi:MAG: hypothetical protein ABEH77_00500 [Halobacteriaceae archaeon]
MPDTCTAANGGGRIGIITAVRSLVGETEQSRVYECRHCGTTVEADTEECPACGRASVTAFEVG